MQFTIPKPEPFEPPDSTLRVGNVYACKGGGKTRYWIVVGLDERAVNLLGVNSDGVVTSTVNYGVHVFRSPLFNSGRPLIGRCEGVADLCLDITWLET